MRRAITALAVLALGAGIAQAQPSDLSNGVFITHHPPGIVDSAMWGSWCPNYAEFAITTCEEQNPTIPLGEGERGVWYVLGAFDGDKTWCGVEFGLSYIAETVLIDGCGQCPTDALILPTGDWPGPGSGIAIATTASQWSGNFQPVFWFTSIAYGAGEIQIVANPETGFGGFANCMTPPTAYPAVCFGALGLYQDGVTCCPVPPLPHACCVGNECVLVYWADECTAQGGIDHPEWATCDGNPCGSHLPNVCCVGHECFLVWETECAAMEGHWLPDVYDCGPPNPCDMYTPAAPTSWGAIKAVFR